MLGSVFIDDFFMIVDGLKIYFWDYLVVGEE